MIKIISLVIFMLLAYINYRHLNLGYLSMHSIDEYAFHGSLQTMYEGLVSFDIKKLFSFGFYSYGFGFFAINLLATAPFFATNNTEMAIYVPRLITSLFAVGSLYFIYKIAIFHIDKISALLLTILIVCMPAFWRNALWFHPDWMMTFFIVLTVYFLSKDNWDLRKYFWYSSISFGVALATKVQAITFLPVIFLYIFYSNFQHQNILDLFSKSKMFLKSIFLSFSIFVLVNPYLIHPTGLKAFISSFIENMKSNATNHGLDVKVTLMDKINNAVDFYYLDIFVFFGLILISFFLVSLIFKKEKEKSLIQIMSVYFLLNIGYLFLMVNKDWHHYYLTLFVVSPLILIPLLMKYQKFKYILLGGLVFFQLATHLQEYKIVLTQGYHPEKEMNVNDMKKISDSLIVDIKSFTNQNTNILIEAYVPFDYELLSLKYQNIHVIYGPIARNMFELDAFLEKSNSKDPAKFKIKDFIILSKNSIYFDQARLSKMVDKTGYVNALEIIGNLNNGSIGYEKFNENEYFYVWRRK